MAVVTLKPTNGTLTIGVSASLQNFSSQVTNCRLVPKADQGDPIYVLSGESVAGDFTETYTLEGTILQDFGSVGSKQEWLLTNTGQTFPFEFSPKNGAGTKKLTGSLVVSAVEIGGDVNTVASADFSFTVIGKPNTVAGS